MKKDPGVMATGRESIFSTTTGVLVYAKPTILPAIFFGAATIV